MTNMIEKVARALCAADCIGPVDVNDPYVDANWPRYAKTARAAIEAMREPTPEMLDGYCDPRNDAMKQAVAAEWRAMISEALK